MLALTFSVLNKHTDPHTQAHAYEHLYNFFLDFISRAEREIKETKGRTNIKYKNTFDTPILNEIFLAYGTVKK